MGLSATQSFLLAAHRSAGVSEYFRWHAVGAALGYSEAQSQSAMQSLGERRLFIVLSDGNARLLDAGRPRALRLERKSVGERGPAGGGGRRQTGARGRS